MLERVGYHPDPDNPDWLVRPQSNGTGFLDFYGPLRVRMESATVTRMRLTPQAAHRNVIDTVHGGFLLAVIDHALFIGPGIQGRDRVDGGNTVDVTAQFLAPVVWSKPIDVLIETLRETYRMVFLRGTIEQSDVASVAFSGIIKKASPSQ